MLRTFLPLTTPFSQPQPKQSVTQNLRRILTLSLALLLFPAAQMNLSAQQVPPPPPDQQQPPNSDPQSQPYNQPYPDQQQPYSQVPQQSEQQYPQPNPDQQQPAPDQQYAPGYPQQPQQALSPDQIEQLVAPIALYPDSLVAQILAASTYPPQLAEADRWRQSMGNASPDDIAAQANAQPWDASVKALTAFPQVLANLDQNLSWTTELGNAYFNQPQDVANAIQTLRQRAQASGNLQSTPQEQVTDNQGYVDIAPANPQIVYVPAYNPWAVYGAPIAPWPGFYYGGGYGWYGVRFGLGCVLTAFTHWPWGFFGWGFDWFGHGLLFQHQFWFSHSRSLVDWGLAHGGPRAYWGRNEIAGRGYYGRSGGGYYGRTPGRFNPRPVGPARPPENFRGGYPNSGYRAPQQSFNRAPAFNARPGYNLPSRNFAQSRSSAPGYDNRSFQNYNRPQAQNRGFGSTFRQPAQRSMPNTRAYSGNQFSRGGFDQRSSRSFNSFSSRPQRSGGYQSFVGSHSEKSYGGGSHFSGGGHSGGGGHFGGGGHSSGGGHSGGGGHHR